MKIHLLKILLFVVSCSVASGSVRYVTLQFNTFEYDGPIITNSEIAIASNEVATIVSASSMAYPSFIKNGLTNNFMGEAGGYIVPKIITGPAVVRISSSTGPGFCTVKIETMADSFPPGQTLILPQGTVGTVHVESSTNLIQWQDEWVHTFANTNENRFYRIRAERSLP